MEQKNKNKLSKSMTILGEINKANDMLESADKELRELGLSVGCDILCRQHGWERETFDYIIERADNKYLIMRSSLTKLAYNLGLEAGKL
jgi:hypothetical protein